MTLEAFEAHCRAMHVLRVQISFQTKMIVLMAVTTRGETVLSAACLTLEIAANALYKRLVELEETRGNV